MEVDLGPMHFLRKMLYDGELHLRCCIVPWSKALVLFKMELLAIVRSLSDIARKLNLSFIMS